MRHVHSWRTSGYLLVGLPDRHAMADRVIEWECTLCPEVWIITCTLQLGVPIGSPEARAALARQAGEPH